VLVPGDPSRDMTSVRKIDDYSFEQVNKKDGKVTTTSRAVYAKDGKSRTFTMTGMTPQGQVVNNVVMIPDSIAIPKIPVRMPFIDPPQSRF